MSAQPFYSGPGYIKLEGIPDLESETITFKLDTGNTSVKTLLKGRAGHSKGAKEVEVTVSDAVPKNPAVRIKWPRIAALQGEINITFVFDGDEYPCVGDIRNASYESGVDKPNSGSFTFSGRLIETE